MQDKIKTKTLAKKVKKEMKRIRTIYAVSLNKEDKKPFDEWLCDNYYILDREADAGLEALRQVKYLAAKSELPRIYLKCEELCENGIAPDEDSLTASLEAFRINGREAELLPVMLRLALLHRAYESIELQGKQGAELLGNVICSLRNLPDTDFNDLNEKLNPVEKILSLDPAGVYTKMDDRSRAMYRRRVALLAERTGKDEEVIAYGALKKAREGKTERERHIGSFLAPGTRKKAGTLFLAAEAVVPLLVSATISVLMREPWLMLLLPIPMWEVTGVIIRAAASYASKTSMLPRMSPEYVASGEMGTLITVSSLLPGADKLEPMKEHLRELYLSNGGKGIRICLLADLKGAKTPERPEDGSETDAAEKMINSLNDSFGGGFIFAVRPRVFSETQESFTGWERKRGAITQLIREISGETGGFLKLCGDIGGLCNIKYIIALDGDTSMTMDTAAELVCVAEHPLNRPIIDVEKGAVTDGYGILAPNVGVSISCSDTSFSRIMAGDFGITPYDSVTSERYQDFFGEGIFAGKGLIDVKAFYTLLNSAMPEEKILSHDILEGGYLRCGFVSDLQVTDGFPKKQGAYFDRMERWIRGDWQNMTFIFGKNPLNTLSRYKLFDNLRRSITPIFASIAVLLSIFADEKTAAVIVAVAVLSVSGGSLLSAARSVVSGGAAMLSRLFYSDAMPAALGDISRGVVNIITFPQTAWISLCAVCRALWRSFVSKKKLLEWTTFAQSESGGSVRKNLLRCLPLAVSATVLLIFGESPQRLCGILFLLGIPFSLLSGTSKEKKSTVTKYFDREKLISCAASMWRYFEELGNAENNFLPPDNMQETPLFRIAQRTSPTNIGLMLMCVLAARDLGFIDSESLYDRLDKTLGSVEKLEKYCGNLLNWYDTRNLRPLYPKYVSTVDSGNFVCCLTALKQGICEYCGELPRLSELAVRIEKLISETDLSILYNERRRLFHIGLDLEKNELSPSFYDLLMSEARMTGYYAVASRVVPKKHWSSLGRTLAREGRYTGLVSWTGTMFEYFMPYIFMPADKGTLGFEALKFCAWCQKNRTMKRDADKKITPWGISESGFYCFDRQLNYQYKAHGVQKLGLKRGLNSELVISPYSTFLVMPLEPASAMKNLKLLEDMEMTGRCGFYEAADFTQSRTNGQNYAVVRSYMAHHVGMSMLCVLNALKDNIVQKRFMSDDKMSSARELLNEKIPIGASVFKDIELRNVPRTRERTEPQKREFDTFNPSNPHVKLLTNGEWTSAVTDIGVSSSYYGGVSVMRHSKDVLRRPQGVFAVLKCGNTSIPVSYAPGYPDDVTFRCEFASDSVTHMAEKNDLKLKMCTTVHPRISGEKRTVTVKNTGQTTADCELILYFEPSLAAHSDAQAHPAFSKLFIEDRYDKSNSILTFTRRPRNGENTKSLSAGLAENMPFKYETSRTHLLKNGYGTQALLDTLPEFTESTGVPDVCCAFRIPIKLPPRGNKKISLLVAAASSEKEAAAKVLKMREEERLKEGGAAPELFREGGLEAVIADAVVPGIIYIPRMTERLHEAIAENTLPKNALWRFGISGDWPILYIEVENINDAAHISPYVRVCDRLRSCGIMCDIVIGYREGGEYDMPLFSSIRKAIISGKADSNSTDGVYTVNLTQYSDEEINSLKASSSYIAPIEPEKASRQPKTVLPMKIFKTESLKSNAKNVKLYSFTDGAIRIGINGKKPEKPWCMVFANKSFGTLVSDKALGFTWAINSRQNKLTPWYNDVVADNRGELIILRLQNKNYDLLLNAEAEFSPKSAIWRGKASGIEYEVTVSVPDRGMVKNCTVRLINKSNRRVKTEAVYYTEPVLGTDREDMRFIRAEKMHDGVITNSPRSEISGFAMLKTDKADSIYTDREAFWGLEKTAFISDICAAVGKIIVLDAGDEKTVSFSLSWAADRKAAMIMDKVQKNDKKDGNYLKVTMQDKAMERMVNTWLPAQITGSRIFGRTGFYQCGGAWGFRDQLQDVMSVIPLIPDLAKTQILRCCYVQFREGDVLHWWHRIPGKNGGIIGVRTRYSDDLLWLTYVTAEYVEQTGDSSILDIEISYLEGDVLSEDERERYFKPGHSSEKGTVFEHCIRAVERSLAVGEHGLSLIGGGDWNDGYNNIGIYGKGESAWLSQFLSMVLKKAAFLCKVKGLDGRFERYTAFSRNLLESIDQNAWDGDRYVRAFFDNGSVLGAKGIGECEIDSISQSFAVLSDMPDTERLNIALDTAIRELADRENNIIKLLAPPFTGKGKNAGYITAYPPGIRENGGQYTHAAVWLCRALLKIGRFDEGIELLKMINPADFCEDDIKLQKYGAEPYALAGDVSAYDKITGCTGWSLYTGAAGWYYSTIMENLLGISLFGNKMTVDAKIFAKNSPCIVEIRIKNTEITIKSEKQGEDVKLTENGKEIQAIMLDGRNHLAEVK